jgi:hypothetical protein
MACFVAEFSCCVPRWNMIIYLLSLLIRVYGTLFPSQNKSSQCMTCHPKLLNSTWGYTVISAEGIPVNRLLFFFYECYEWWQRVWWIINYKYFNILYNIINKIINNYIVLTACTPALSFFQNPALDRESNPHLIF